MVNLILVSLAHRLTKVKSGIIIAQILPKSTRSSILLIGNDMAEIFSETFLDIMSLKIPNKIITCNDKDAPWMTSDIKTSIKRNTRVHR